MRIENTHTADLVLPGGVSIPAAGAVDIAEKDWVEAQSSAVVKAWVEAGMLVDSTGGVDPEPKPIDDDEITYAAIEEMSDEQLHEVIVEKAGKKAHPNTGRDKLVEAVAELLDVQKPEAE